MQIYKKTIFSFLIFVSSLVAAKNKESLTDVTYKFDPVKLEQAQDSFHFLRTYVDYYYLLIKENESSLKAISPLLKYAGQCVGDAHAENFGFLLQENLKPLFTMNDIDDFGPCPVVLDIFRFLLSSKLYDQNLSVKNILQSYQDGLNGKKQSKPDILEKMKKTAEENGLSPSHSKVKNQKFIREDGVNEVDRQTQDLILQKTTEALKIDLKLVDLIETSKQGGGSGGLQRYELLVLTDDQKLIHLELKDEIAPSVYPVATGEIPNAAQKIQQAILLEQGKNASSFYGFTEINSHDFFIRPRFAGNIGITLADQKHSSENRDIIIYEAYRLGEIHARSLSPQVSEYAKAISAMKNQDIEDDIANFSDFFNKKYSKLIQKN